MTVSGRTGVRLHALVLITDIESCYTDPNPAHVLSLFNDGATFYCVNCVASLAGAWLPMARTF
jgi:hypothetical protein